MVNTKLSPKEREMLASFRSLDEYGYGELSIDILKVVAFGGFLATALVAPNLAQVYKFFTDIDKRKRQKLYWAIRNLKENGLIAQKGEKYYVTPKGRVEINRQKIHSVHLSIARNKKWDGVWRIVTFDIPEDKKVARVALGRKLKKENCIQLQKSVFIYPHECRKEIERIGRYFGVEKNLIFIDASHVSEERKLQKTFKKLRIL